MIITLFIVAAIIHFICGMIKEAEPEHLDLGGWFVVLVGYVFSYITIVIIAFCIASHFVNKYW